MTIQGRQLSEADIEQIRSLMAEHPDWLRSRLSVELCEIWNWRTDNGALKDIACRSMLRKLEDRKLIELPPPARVFANRVRRIRDVAHDREPITSELRHLRPIELTAVRGRGAEDDLFHCLMDRYHYLGCRGTVGEYVKYMVRDGAGRPLACLLFGSAAWRISDRERYIGWDDGARKRNLKLMTNNARFLILPWVRVKNLASHVLGACMRRLGDDWRTRYGHDLFLVETFVDRSRFAGACYQAANWTRIGQTRGRTRQDRHKRIKVPVKDIYMYPLTADFKRRLCA